MSHARAIRWYIAIAAVLCIGRWAPGQATQPESLPPFSGGEPITATPTPDPLVADVRYVVPNDNWPSFLILIWQYKTSAPDDADLYRKAGFWGFHIDRGAAQQKLVDFAVQNKMPYYVDHLAGKGYLHLTENTGKTELLAEAKKGQPLPRPNSLADDQTIATVQKLIRDNLAVVSKGPVVAYAFDDEISLGSFNTPAEVDSSPASLDMYRQWLRQTYVTLDKLNATWGTKHTDFAEIQPTGFETVRANHTDAPFAKWNLAPWMDWRSFMDSQFAGTLSQLTRYTNDLTLNAPAGFVGGQQPAPYGGYDYAKVCRAVQFIEAYDIGATSPILRSFWCYPQRRPFVQTFFSTGDAKRDSWFLWYYLLNGNRGVIAWPEAKNQSWFHSPDGIADFILKNAQTNREVQGEVSKKIVDPTTRFDVDPIAVLYSHPSIQASWAMDASAHGRSWPNRSSSLDNACQTAGKNREAWFKLLEDCGFQYHVVSAPQVERDHLIRNGYRVLILNRAIALSDAQADAIRRFVAAGGTVIADHLTGALTDHGTGRPTGALDDLFGIVRDDSQGYLDGKTIAEINGEKYQAPFLDRLDGYAGALKHDGIVVYERGTRATVSNETQRTLIEARAGKGKAVYLNLTPLAYFDLNQRIGDYGTKWRTLLTRLLADAGLHPRARVLAAGQPVPLAEVVYYRTAANRQIVGVVKNPTRDGTITGPGQIHGVTGDELDVTIEFAAPVQNVVNLRTGQALPDGKSITAHWKPWEALVFEMDAPPSPQ